MLLSFEMLRKNMALKSHDCCSQNWSLHENTKIQIFTGACLTHALFGNLFAFVSLKNKKTPDLLE